MAHPEGGTAQRHHRAVVLAVVGVVGAAACGAGPAATPAGDTSDVAASRSPGPSAPAAPTPTGPTTTDATATPSGATTTPSATPTAPVTDPRPVALTSAGPAFPPAGDERFANAGAVAVDPDGGLLALRTSFSGLGGASRTDLLRSDDDGRTWREVGPVLGTRDVPFARGTASPMALLAAPDGSWVLYLETLTSLSAPGVIGRATAPAPEGPWTVDEEPVLEPGPPGSWDDLRVGEPHVEVDGDGTWRMWFTGHTRAGPSAIGHATSPDGVTWTRDPAPVLTGGAPWDGGSVGGSRVARVDDGWVLLYDAVGARADELGLAFSRDGRAWTPSASNPVVGTEEHDPLVPLDVVAPGPVFQAGMVATPAGLLVLLEAARAGGGTTPTTVRVDLGAAG